MLVHGEGREVRWAPTVERLGGGCFLVQRVEFSYLGQRINGIVVTAQEDSMTDEGATRTPSHPARDIALNHVDSRAGTRGGDSQVPRNGAAPVRADRAEQDGSRDG